MKLTEIKRIIEDLYDDHTAFWKITDPTTEQYLEYLGLDSGSYINKRNVVNVRFGVSLKEQSIDALSGTFLVQWGEIDGKFSLTNFKIPLAEFTGPTTVHGDFSIDHYSGKNLMGGPTEVAGGYAIHACHKLQSVEGAPERVDGFMLLEANSLKNLQHCPRYVGNEVAIDADIDDLTDVADIFDTIGGDFCIRWDAVTKGGLGLLNIKKLKGLITVPGVAELPAPFKIINEYLKGHADPTDRDIFECQQELIDAGFEEFTHM